MTLAFTKAERAQIAKTDALKRSARKAAKSARPVSAEARQRDLGFLSWLHEGIPCVACEIEGPAFTYATGLFSRVPMYYPIEGAHQKHVAGKGGMLGKRPDDAGHTCPLCAWHHRLAPNACDPAQRKFWARLRVDVAAFCRALLEAYRNGESGAAVVRRFAAEARASGHD